MKKFDIPLYIQEEGSVDCGPTCVRMILEYYGIKKSFDELQKALYYTAVGTSIFDNGSLLLDNGLKVMSYTAQPMLFPADKISELKTNNDIRKIIVNKMNTHENYKNNLTTFIKYLDKGGEINVEIPTFAHVKTAIDNGSPVLALLYGQALGANEGEFHFVVVSGYDDDMVFINSSWPQSIKQGWFPLKNFLYAVHTSTTADIDNGTLLIATRK